jgi:hypothetical protein
MVKIYMIPGLLFLLDFVLRVVLGIDLLDTGADMALLAVATFVSLLLEDVGEQQYHLAAVVVFIILFLALWIICLKIVSVQNPIMFFAFDFRTTLCWFVGLTSFVFSGVMANEIIQDSSESVPE